MLFPSLAERGLFLCIKGGGEISIALFVLEGAFG